MHEKNELNKELAVSRELVADTLKQNAVLNEEIKVKTDYIKAFEEVHKLPRDISPTISPAVNNLGEETSETISSPPKTQKEKPPKKNPGNKCESCDFETCVTGHLKGHNVAHTGQYQCLRG